MTDDFYRAFEEKLRGSRQLIKQRLEVYLQFIRPLANFYPEINALDLGCGRGEWLELLRENGIDAKGIDLDEGMLNACRQQNLDVETADVIQYLKNLPDSSLTVVSGFHLAEHLPFELLKELISQVKRVLVSGGVFILETPNPENIMVGTCNFYFDPTHQRPIPPLLLEFLLEYYGFPRVKTVRLQEDPRLHVQGHVKLLDVLAGVSPDYAVIAQNQGASAQMELLDIPFKFEYGVTLSNLAIRFQKQIELRLESTEKGIEQTILRLTEVQKNISQYEQALDRANQYRQQLDAVYNSRSWRITAPIRWISDQFRLIRENGLKKRIMLFNKKVQKKILHAIIRKPMFKVWCVRLAHRIGVANWTNWYIQRLLHPQASRSKNDQLVKKLQTAGVAHLSPVARKIHAGLSASILRNKK